MGADLVHILHYYYRMRRSLGGIVHSTTDICKTMAERGHRVTLMTYDDHDVPESWKNGHAEGRPALLRLDPPRAAGLLGQKSLELVHDAVGAADVIHLHTPWDPANVQIARIARRLGTPYVLSVHGMLDDWCLRQKYVKKRLYLELAGKWFLRNAQSVHYSARFEETQGKRWAPPELNIVIPSMVDLSLYETLPGPSIAREKFASDFGEGPVALFLSRVDPKKGIELLIDAAAVLRDRGVDCTFLIAGTAKVPEYEASLRALVEARDVADRVRFLGFVAGIEKLSLYEAADVFVLPTSQENFGLVLAESLACRTPVISTRGVDIWPELEESGGAIIIDRESPAIADAVAELLADDARRAEMGEKGRAWVFEFLDTERIAREMEKWYQAAASEGRALPAKS